MNQATLDRLIVSIRERRLVAFCGAGLSMSKPSSVPSAQILTEQVVQEYRDRALPALPVEATSNLETLSEYFWGHGLEQLFVDELVRWRPFRRLPNEGHRTIADLLTSEALQFCVTTNFDELVEVSATDLGEDSFDASYDLDSATQPRPHRAYVKLHGCVRDREHTSSANDFIYPAWKTHVVYILLLPNHLDKYVFRVARNVATNPITYINVCFQQNCEYNTCREFIKISEFS